MDDEIPVKRLMPAEKAMKQTSKTAYELGNENVQESGDDDLLASKDGPTTGNVEKVAKSGLGNLEADATDAEPNDPIK